MQIFVNNLGPLETARWSSKNLNVIAGPNGSGKTYLAHAIYSLLKGTSASFGRSSFETTSTLEGLAQQLLEYKTVGLNHQESIRLVRELIEQRSLRSALVFMNYVNASAKSTGCPLRIALDDDTVSEIFFRGNYKFGYAIGAINSICVLEVSSAKQTVTLSLRSPDGVSHINNEDKNLKLDIIQVNHTLKNLFETAFTTAVPAPYVLSAERTGITLFQQDIDFGRSRMVEELRIEGSEALNTIPRATWSPAVEDNFNAFRSLNRARENSSFIADDHPAILELFDQMVSGRFVEKDGEFKFAPQGAGTSIAMVSTSSTVRSLFELDIFLRHIAKKGQWLIIDEPELNLHPKNQVLMGRLLAALSNAGLKILITTHSDYIVRELSILVLLSQREQANLPEGYAAEYSLSPDDIRVDYTVFQNNSHRSKLVSAEVNPEEGIASPFFDETIRTQNDHLEEALWG